MLLAGQTFGAAVVWHSAMLALTWPAFCCGTVVRPWLTHFIPQTKIYRFHHDVISARKRETRSGSVLSFLCSFCGSNSWTNLRCYNVFWARKQGRIDNLLPLKFRTQMVSLIQNILTKNLETICRVILEKQKNKTKKPQKTKNRRL